uniref:Glycogen debranching enzyme/amylo-alpha-1,6-glucosidase n=1 Tax=Rostrostelium ellipticum TaxID=361140 RepID=A0A1L2FUY6_9MYCE|nr:glycogen debranching enzyme/amylo-alpha-1,6-glucosidase [Rostrostelium ellipticum]
MIQPESVQPEASAQVKQKMQIETPVGGSDNVFSITLGGNGAEPPFSRKGLALPRAGLLRIIIPAGLEVTALEPSLLSNYPTSDKEPFVRERLTASFTRVSPYSGRNDIVFEQRISRAGCFDYAVEWREQSSGKTKRGSLGTFQVAPQLQINGCPLPGAGIVLQTVLTKCMGPIAQWEPHIASASAAGYNMIHFTPVQQVGASGSAYSIFDQLSLSTSLFAKDAAPSGEQARMQALGAAIKDAEQRHGILSMVDLVWNHTAHNSAWLIEHPEAGYNPENSPHLKPAIVLDTALAQHSRRLDGVEVLTVEQLDDLIVRLCDDCIQPLRLWEFYVLDVTAEMVRFDAHAPPPSSPPPQLLPLSPKGVNESPQMLTILLRHVARDPSYERHSLRVDTEAALRSLSTNTTFRNYTPEERRAKYEDLLRLANLTLYREYDQDLEAMLSNIRERVKYERISTHGPRLGPISVRSPLVASYFTQVVVRDAASNKSRTVCLANNGWIYNYNPSVDFASGSSKAYLRRDVIVWGDCVKLRYGASPADNPWLWKHMRDYTERMASLFHAIRIDNCHSTPIHVAQYLLDAARAVRPSLYVTCELFTGSEELDDEFVRRLGINSLIREAMVCHDSWELGRVTHRYGGRPVASLLAPHEHSRFVASPHPYEVQPLAPHLPPALFMDCTHDNQTPAQKRTVQDSLPNSAIVAMTVSAIGSTRGYDELFPATIDLISNQHILPLIYTSSYDEIHIHQEHNVILIQRFSPSLNKSVFLLAHTAFSHPTAPEDVQLPEAINIPCRITEFVAGARISNVHQFNRNDSVLTGIDVDLEVYIGDKVFERFCYVESELKDFPPGSILIFRGEVPKDCVDRMKSIGELVANRESLQQTLQPLSLIDLNFLLFRHPYEEQQGGGGGYNLPGYGTLPFCGLQGFATILDRVSEWNDLSHPLCNNVREGNWAIDYIVGRLSSRPALCPLQGWISQAFELVKQLPRHFIPKYFNLVVLSVYRRVIERVISHMSPFVQQGGWFVHSLALASVQFYGVCTPLLNNSAVLSDFTEPTASMAAGLPHFCAGYMRSWGRDTFIALRGLLLSTNRLQEAKQLIIGFGASLQFGLIPNLLDSGNRPRYNSRDSTWWYLKSVQEFSDALPSDTERRAFLSTRILRLFPRNPSQPHTTLHDLIQEIMQEHANGIKFREPFAGKEIDEKMKDEGFNIEINLNQENGFLYGGNLANCGTWMDKMGDSARAHNLGDPATPRDGAPIEITAMLFCTLRWLVRLNKAGLFSHAGVGSLTYDAWQQRLSDNFERFYYVPGSADDKKFQINTSFVRRRHIYKDTVGGRNGLADYQFRPNFLVAMAMAPELFTRERASKTLDLARSFLLGPLGVKTLDPNDTDYHANYDNSLDTDYRPTAKGFNYHNGPEWLWPYGFYLEALMLFGNHSSPLALRHTVESLLVKHKAFISQSSFASLPELTNRDGAPCRDGCDSQAWSIGTILAALHRLCSMNNQ